MLALAKRRRMWDYDAVTLSAACNSPVLITEGLAGVRGKYGSKIEIRYNGSDLCVITIDPTYSCGFDDKI